MEPERKRLRVEEAPPSSPAALPAAGAAGAGGDHGAAEVRALLARLGLLRYLPKFVESGFDMIEAVRAMDESDMREECGMAPEHAALLQHELTVGTSSASAASAAPPPPPPPPPASDGGGGGGAGRGADSFAVAPASQMLQALHLPAPPPPSGPAAGAPPADDAGEPPPKQQTAGAMAAAAAGVSAEGYDQCCGLTQLAEEAAQMNSAAAALSSNTALAPLQIASIAEVAQTASQRATWAAGLLAKFEVQLGDQEMDTSWLSTMRQAAKKAADVADDGATSCKVAAASVRESCLESLRAKKSRVPCKNYLSGRCNKGLTCDFSHDAADMQARPLMLKSMKQCIFFAKGSCMRGPACPFSHGEEESREIEKYVDILRKEKKTLGGGRR